MARIRAMRESSVVITGASSGIGWATTQVLVARGVHVVAGVRRAEDATRLREAFGDRVTPQLLNVTDPESIAGVVAAVSAGLGGMRLSGLVNNAGVAVGGPLLHLPPDEFRRQLEVNLVGPLLVTQAFLPLLGTDRSRSGAPGRIVNISSVAGQFGQPFLGAYVASKHGLEGLSASLRRELMIYGVDVIVVGPGAVRTPIWDKAEQSDMTPYAGSEYAGALAQMRTAMVETGRKGLPAARIGEVIWKALTTAHPRTRYTVVPQPLRHGLLSALPARLVDRIVARRLFGKRWRGEG